MPQRLFRLTVDDLTARDRFDLRLTEGKAGPPSWARKPPQKGAFAAWAAPGTGSLSVLYRELTNQPRRTCR